MGQLDTVTDGATAVWGEEMRRCVRQELMPLQRELREFRREFDEFQAVVADGCRDQTEETASQLEDVQIELRCLRRTVRQYFG